MAEAAEEYAAAGVGNIELESATRQIDRVGSRSESVVHCDIQRTTIDVGPTCISVRRGTAQVERRGPGLNQRHRLGAVIRDDGVDGHRVVTADEKLRRISTRC